MYRKYTAKQEKGILFGTARIISAAKGCRQVRVLSRLLWNLVVDELLCHLDEKGIDAQAFAEYLKECNWMHWIFLKDGVMMTVNKSDRNLRDHVHS